MPMTKKDYEAIARAIQRELEKSARQLCGFPDPMLIGVARSIAEAVADHAATRDKAFKRERFLKACGVAYPDHGGDE